MPPRKKPAAPVADTQPAVQPEGSHADAPERALRALTRDELNQIERGTAAPSDFDLTQ